MWDETTRENLLALREEVSFPRRTAQAALKLPVSALGGSISEDETANVPLLYNLWYVIIVMLRFEDLKTQRGTGGTLLSGSGHGGSTEHSQCSQGEGKPR